MLDIPLTVVRISDPKNDFSGFHYGSIPVIVETMKCRPGGQSGLFHVKRVETVEYGAESRLGACAIGGVFDRINPNSMRPGE